MSDFVGGDQLAHRVPDAVQWPLRRLQAVRRKARQAGLRALLPSLGHPVVRQSRVAEDGLGVVRGQERGGRDSCSDDGGGDGAAAPVGVFEFEIFYVSFFLTIANDRYPSENKYRFKSLKKGRD